MARVYADRVLETTTSTGTGDIALDGAATGYAGFAAACAVGDTFDYAIFAVDGDGVATGAWETGRGTYSAADTLTRTAVHASSNSDALVSFAAGTKFVILSHNAASIAAGGGGGGSGNPEAPWTVPVLADFSSYNLGTVTLADSVKGIGINFPAGNGFGVRGILQAAPATPWTVYVRLDCSFVAGENNTRFGIAVHNTSTDRSIQFGFQGYSNAQKQVSRERWTGANSYHGQNVASYYEGEQPWLRLENDGTDLTFSIGDGYNWLEVAATTLVSFIGSVDSVGVLVQSSYASLVVVNSFDFSPPA